MAKEGICFFGLGLGLLCLNEGYTIVLLYMGTLQEIAVFQPTFKLFVVSLEVYQFVVKPLVPRIYLMFLSKQSMPTGRLLSYYLGIVGFICLAAAFCFYLTYPVVISAWLHDDTFQWEQIERAKISIGLALGLFSITNMIILLGANKHVQLGLIGVFCALTFVASCFTFVDKVMLSNMVSVLLTSYMVLACLTFGSLLKLVREKI
ncbi:hypothetical protein N9L23_06100 [Alphaproteobacteria bacterium]|nr:hypothetical protein [Alphaproteobacteria bacterium]